LRSQGRICATDSVADRRRHHWQLSAIGRELLDQTLIATVLRHHRSGDKSSSDISGDGRREAAA
jgi:hypothetical protein